MSELWRTVPSVDGLMASTLGRVMVTPYVASLPNGGTRQYGGVPNVGQWDGKRYIYVHRGKTYKVARLVCEAFHGAPLATAPYCLHANEDARDNRPENLSWGTQKQNLNAPGFLAYCRQRTGDASPIAKARRKHRTEMA